MRLPLQDMVQNGQYAFEIFWKSFCENSFVLGEAVPSQGFTKSHSQFLDQFLRLKNRGGNHSMEIATWKFHWLKPNRPEKSFFTWHILGDRLIPEQPL